MIIDTNIDHSRFVQMDLKKKNIPGWCILGRNAPRQVVVTVVPSGVVKEVSSGGEHVVRYPSGALRRQRQKKKVNDAPFNVCRDISPRTDRQRHRPVPEAAGGPWRRRRPAMSAAAPRRTESPRTRCNRRLPATTEGPPAGTFNWSNFLMPAFLFE